MKITIKPENLNGREALAGKVSLATGAPRLQVTRSYHYRGEQHVQSNGSRNGQ